MSKYLICYEIGIANSGGHVSGHSILRLGSLTSIHLDTFAKETKAETAALHKGVEFQNLVFRSVSRLDD